MTVVSRQAMSDDDGTFTFGTAVNKAFIDAIYDQIDDQTHSAANPTIKPKAITDEVVTARGGEANLAAKLATLSLTNYLLGTSDLGSTWKVAGGRSLQFDDTDVAHGMTAIFPTTVFGSIDAFSGTIGGLSITGLSDADQRGLKLLGINGGAAPTEPGITIAGSKKSGTGAVEFAANEVVMKFNNHATEMARFLGSGSLWVLARLGVPDGSAGAPSLGPSGSVDVGLFFSSSAVGISVINHEVIKFSSNGGTIAYWEMTEHSDAGAPAANGVRVYARDTGGKTELVARFATGTIQRLAIEP